MKILLFGKGGQVGWELQRALSPLGELIALDSDSTAHCGNFIQLEGLAQTVRTVRPDVIVNAAAHTAVDKAESEPALAHTVNAVAPEVLAVEAAKLGAWLVHYSTDYVFDGSGDRPWLESDAPAPLSVYGTTKREGETRVAAANPRHLVFRTSWVYAARGGNFAKTMLRLAQERERLTVINDQFGAPTGAELVADVTAHAIRRVTSQPSGDLDAGLYHLAASGFTTWFDYANHVLAQAQLLQPAITIKATRVDPVATSAFSKAARRPRNSRLDTGKLQSTFGLTLPPWQLGVNRMLDEIL